LVQGLRKPADNRRVLQLSWHGVQRWQQRVDPLASTAEARQALAEFVTQGHLRSTPRHWTAVDPQPGLAFLYWVHRPDVCALVWDGTVVTVITRQLCGADVVPRPRHLRVVSLGRSKRTGRVAVDSDWRWPRSALDLEVVA
jgi:hypothetical protein